MESATLFQSDGDNVAPDDGDVRLWESTSLDLVALVGAGVTPESEGREISLDPDEEYLVVVKTSANLAASYVFDSGVLTSDGYWVEGRNLSDADFAKLAAESCFRQP